MAPDDERYLRAAIKIAWRARKHGNHPFGAVLTDAEGQVVLEAKNTVTSERDCTAHAETNLMRLAGRDFSPAFRRGCTIYTSAEVCPMCTGAIYWGNVRRIVFGLSQYDLRAITGGEPDELALPMPCREVLAHGEHDVDVIGPALADQAAAVHHGFVHTRSTTLATSGSQR